MDATIDAQHSFSAPSVPDAIQNTKIVRILFRLAYSICLLVGKSEDSVDKKQ